MGGQLLNATIFGLLDFLELDVASSIPTPNYNYFAGLDFNVSIEGEPNIFGSFHNMKLAEELINLRLNELQKADRLQDPNEAQKVDAEAMQALRYFQSENNQRQLRSARQETLTAWVDLVALVVSTFDFNEAGKAALIFQAFQLITPKLETYVSFNSPEAIVIAQLVQNLLFQLDFKISALDQSHASSVTNDRLFQVFRTALRAISCPGLDIPLREVLYSITYRYLSGMTEVAHVSLHRRHGIQIVKLAGDRTMDTVCDDAYGASATCRIAALLFLDSLAQLANTDHSDYIVNSLVRTNFLSILVESIEKMPQDLRDTPAANIPLLLVFYSWQFSLLLTLSRSKRGASLITNAGFFPAIRASGLFSVDPDIGIEIDNSESLAQYYRLLLAITRVVTSVTLSQGAKNEGMLAQAREFLVENRALVVAVFKRDAKIGGVSFDDKGAGAGSIEELVDLFGVLIEMTGFLEVSGSQVFLEVHYKVDFVHSLKSKSTLRKGGSLALPNGLLDCRRGPYGREFVDHGQSVPCCNRRN